MAALARNVFLFTFIQENHTAEKPGTVAEQSSILWNIFYHLFVPDKELALLQDHASSLVQYSESIDTWSSSSYGKAIKFLNWNTLFEVRRFWSLYAGTKDASTIEAQALEARVKKTINASILSRFEGDNQALISHGVRSAGANSMSAFQLMSNAFQRYWHTGVVAGNDEDVASLGPNGRGNMNPMLTYSSAPSGEFSVHYGSDPLLGFHLADVFDRVEPASTSTTEIAGAAKAQFQSWCFSFSKYLCNDAVRIIVHCGEVINLCYELQSYQSGRQLSKLTHLYSRPWHAKPLALTEPDGVHLAKPYNVIDTSNLIDHVGILNVLPAATPLLSRDASSVLYTESLLLASEDTTQSLGTQLLSDIATTSLLIGLTPVGHLLGTMTDSTATESFLALVAGKQLTRQQQFRVRIPWKRAPHGDNKVLQTTQSMTSSIQNIGIEPTELANYFFGIYLKMFDYEDLSQLMSRTRRQWTTPLAGDLRFYSRASLVALLHFVKSRVVTDWERCIRLLLDMIESDRSLILGSNNLQELYTHLHISGLWNNPGLERNPRDMANYFWPPIRSTSGESGLLKQPNVPPLVHVALIVPRSKLAILTRDSPNEIGTPGFHIAITQEGISENCFFAIDCFFGKLKPVSGDFCDVEEEDHKGWLGNGNLIATCPIPAWSLLAGPRKGLRVGFSVNTSNSPSQLGLTKKLGVRLRVFECGLDDENHIQILRNAPGFLQGRQQTVQHTMSKADCKGETSLPLVALSAGHTLKSISVRKQFLPNSDDQKSLTQNALVSISQQSPCTLQLQIGKSAHSLVYPYPVDGSCSKTKVARKQGWVEVAAPASPALVRGGYDLDPFPVVMESFQPVVWGLGRVNVSQQPSIPMNTKNEWLSIHLGAAMSNNQRKAQSLHASRGERMPGIVDLKESISLLFFSFAGQNPQAPGRRIKAFRLAVNNDCDTIIFAQSIRHDRDTGSILLDAYVVPLTPSRVSNMLSSHVSHSEVLTLNTPAEEAILWKELLPALVERCRSSSAWDHSKKNCKYNSTKKIPLSTAHGESPICTCGEGRDVKGFPAEYKKSFAEYATRIAVAPLFAVPYVESLMPQDGLGDDDDGGVGRLSSQVASQMSQMAIGGGSSGGGSASCDNCGKEKTGLKSCARCGKTKYCNHGCQKAHWKIHKKECKK